MRTENRKKKRGGEWEDREESEFAQEKRKRQVRPGWKCKFLPEDGNEDSVLINLVKISSQLLSSWIKIKILLLMKKSEGEGHWMLMLW
jgi:hypothetical protein